MDKQEKTIKDIDNRPTPDNFDAYLPWACKQLVVDVSVMVIKVGQSEYCRIYNKNNAAA